ncbi:FAD/FMN-containing dehydrogenase/Fe-S oxidoreductase [Constrictibacter sp. MBR-5]|uniref:FAD-binding and (Fe-S)-binding domain-containing protein n=1 Tax=Constrictibacter sp. MBR-5 TaxID=3156467 RepID=UPI0033993B57
MPQGDAARAAAARRRAVKPGDSRLAQRLAGAVEGEVLFDAFTRGRYSTDASIYQVEPIGVVRPKSVADIEAALAIAREEGFPVTARGGGTSQAGQTINEALVVDTSAHLNRILEIDLEGMRARVEPGVVLDQLNKVLRPHGVWFPIDISTASRCTIGGMAANNSCGARSIRYGNMVHNTRGIRAILADGGTYDFGPVPGVLTGADLPPRYADLVQRVRAIAGRERDEIRRRWPQLLRNVAGYNLNTVDPVGHNMASLLVGSEGTLGFFTEVEVDLAPLPPRRVLGICHFPNFRDAMAATQYLVTLDPEAVELVDRGIIELSREMPQFRATVERMVRGEPDALLLVEFAGTEEAPLLRRLRDLDRMMGDLGFPFSVVEAVEPGFQAAVWRVREAGLNIVMSMKGDGKPVSFIEDCAVPLADLADFTDRLTAVFDKHGTRGTWYAHASVGLLHVRPIINLKTDDGTRKLRAIAEEAFELVREYKGSHSGEHGDGIVRAEFHDRIYGSRIVQAFEEVKGAFDPTNLFNPGRVVKAPRMDDRRLFRYGPNYKPLPHVPVLDWGEFGSFLGAAEMCNNNGTCRKRDAGVMCPSFRATEDEQHLTRGRANTLRLALSGQLGADALTSDAMYDTLDLCVGCKGCRRECPTGVDMAKMKVEFLFHYRARHGLELKDRLVAFMPRYAGKVGRVAALLNGAAHLPGARAIGEKLFGFAARRSLPHWSGRPFRAGSDPAAIVGDGRDVALLVDTFNRAFEPDNARAAARVLEAAGYHVHYPSVAGESRPPCCGRTFLSAGLVDEARVEVRRTLDALRPYVEAGVPVVGLEPACLLSLRDEFLYLTPGDEAAALSAQAFLFEEFLLAERAAGRFDPDLRPLKATRALMHGHCHQKSFGLFEGAADLLRIVPGLTVETVESSCCGMAGSFGFDAGHYDVSMKMAELSLLPAVRAADEDTILVADGTSCRHQILDGSGREAVHVARVLESALAR